MTKNEEVTKSMFTTKSAIVIETNRFLEEPETNLGIAIISITVKTKVKDQTVIYVISRSICIEDFIFVRCDISIIPSPFAEVMFIFGTPCCKIWQIIYWIIIMYKNIIDSTSPWCSCSIVIRIPIIWKRLAGIINCIAVEFEFSQMANRLGRRY